MNGDGSKGFLSNPWPIVMVALLGAGVFVEKLPLQSARPADPERARFVAASEQDVEARLWQDPIAAVEATLEKEEARSAREAGLRTELISMRPPPQRDRAHEVEAVNGRIRKTLAYEKRDVQVLAISVPGDSYTQGAETRRRWRYAVVSALAHEKYFSAHADALGYFRVDLPKQAQGTTDILPPSKDGEASSGSQEPEHADVVGTFRVKTPKASDAEEEPGQMAVASGGSKVAKTAEPLSLTVPYEWFASDRNDDVLVIWLNEDKIAAWPQHYLDELFLRLKQGADDRFARSVSTSEKPTGTLKVKMIGPAGSMTLGNLIRDRRQCSESSCKKFEVISPISTMPDADLFKPLPGSGPKDDYAAHLDELAILRTTGTDDTLAIALLDELTRRSVAMRSSAAPCKDGLVLIRELDSQYSRTLTGYLKDAFAALCFTNSGDQAAHVREFTYLRGLDGALPGLDKQADTASRKDTNDKSKDLRAQLDDAPPEHAEGRSQYDYLRRIAAEIDQLDDDKAFAPGGVKAIGIIGVDVYDKLLVLQALRPQFEDKIFFTTDLDARYLHADEKKWTRNLVVASNFDLALHPTLQGSAPPFRDSYETATYLATLTALQPVDATLTNTKMKERLRPQIFEIGRKEAVHLYPPPTDQEAVDSACKGSVATCTPPQPIRQSQLPSADKMWPFFVVAVLGLILVALTSPAVQTAMGIVAQSAAACFCIGAGLLIVTTITSHYYSEMRQSLATGDGEPFVWLEGVSVWPSLVLRFIGLLVAIALIAFFWVKNRREADAIAECFEFGKRESSWRLERGWWQRAFIGPHLDLAKVDEDGVAEGPKGPPKTAAALWQNYLRATVWREEILWIVVAVVLTFSIFFLAFGVLDRPSFPGRGELVVGLHKKLLWANAVTLWSTIFWVGYETRACAGLIKVLSDYRKVPLEWPKACQEARDVPEACRNAYLAFRLVVRASRRIQGLIYLPFVLILFVVVARSDLFDAMNFPLSLVLVTGLALIYAVSTVVLLSKGAKAARESILEQLNGLLLKPIEENPPPSKPVKQSENQIKLLIEQVSKTHEGAFVPLGQQPALQALLLPFGGYGGMQIIESLLLNPNI